MWGIYTEYTLQSAVTMYANILPNTLHNNVHFTRYTRREWCNESRHSQIYIPSTVWFLKRKVCFWRILTLFKVILFIVQRLVNIRLWFQNKKAKHKEDVSWIQVQLLQIITIPNIVYFHLNLRWLYAKVQVKDHIGADK